MSKEDTFKIPTDCNEKPIEYDAEYIDVTDRDEVTVVGFFPEKEGGWNVLVKGTGSGTGIYECKSKNLEKIERDSVAKIHEDIESLDTCDYIRVHRLSGGCNNSSRTQSSTDRCAQCRKNVLEDVLRRYEECIMGEVVID